MATVASLFGPSAEEIVFARKKEEEDAARQKYLARLQGAGQGLGPFAWAARAGVDVGETLRTAGGMFGEQIEDPLIKKYNRINQILVEEGGDLNDPEALKRVADKLQAEGYTNEAVRLYDRSSALSTAARQLDIEEGKMTQLTTAYVDKDGNPVMVNKNTAQFFTPDGTPIPADEVIPKTTWDDVTLRRMAVEKIEGKKAAQDPNSWQPVGLYTEDGTNLIQGGPTGFQAALEERLQQEQEARDKEIRNREGVPDIYDDTATDVEEIRRREAEAGREGDSIGVIAESAGNEFGGALYGGITDPSYQPPNNIGRSERSLTPRTPRYTLDQGITPGMLFDPRRMNEEDIVVPPWDIRYQNRF
jgi:hypothetical protein